MLKFRKEHLDAFEAQAVRMFAARVIAHVKAVWPAECQEIGDPAVAEIVQNGIKRATALGLSSEYDVARFVDLSFILAKDFDTNPLALWSRPILADRTLAPTAKVDGLYNRMEVEFTLIEKRRGPKA